MPRNVAPGAQLFATEPPGSRWQTCGLGNLHAPQLGVVGKTFDFREPVGLEPDGSQAGKII
jgi:hypothetical protein